MLHLITVAASLATTCENVQSLYTASRCCPDDGGTPGQVIPECSGVEFGTTTITGKLENPWQGCIDADEDSEDCPSGSRARFRNGIWKLRTEGKPNSEVSSSGTRAEQLYMEVEEVMYHEGKRSTLVSKAAAEMTAANNGAEILYGMPHPLTTAITYLQQTFSLDMIDSIYPKLNDKVLRFIPQWSKEARNAKKLLKFIRDPENSRALVDTYKYSDFNVYGFVKMEAQPDGSKCVVSELPSGKSAKIECGLPADATLETTPVPNGVLEVKTDPTVPMTLSTTVRDRITSTFQIFDVVQQKNVTTRVFGIDLDLDATNIAESFHPHDLASVGWTDKFEDDASCPLTFVVDIGAEATKYQAGGSDGYRFLNKVVQFCIRPQTQDMTMRDLLTGKAGIDESMAEPRYQLDYPTRYQRIALATMLNRDAIEATRYADKPELFYHRYSHGMKGLGFTDARYVRDLGNYVLSFEPGADFGGDNPSPVMAAVIVGLLEHALTSPTFPKTASGAPDFAAFDLGAKRGDGSDAVLDVTYTDLMKKYVFGPLGVPDSEYFVTFDGVDDPQLDRVPLDYNSAIGYTLNPGLADTNLIRTIFGMPATPPHPTDRILNWDAVWESDTVDAFLMVNGLSRDTPPEELPPSLVNLRELDFLFTEYMTVRGGKNGTTSEEFGMLKANRGNYKTSPYMRTTVRAMEALMSTLMNNGKRNDGVRVFPCAVIAQLSQPMDQTDEQIALTSSYRDPLRSEQSDGRLSITLGMGVSSLPSDFNTQSSLLQVGYGGASYEMGGTRLAFSKTGQFYNVKASSTVDKQPSWVQEASWPGATFLWEKLWRQRYAAHLCLPV